MPDPPPQIGPGATLEDLHRLCRATADVLREAHEFTVASYVESRKITTWLGGLMGAGIFAVPALLSAAPQATRLTVLLSWAVGILCAMLTGVLGGETASRNDVAHVARITLLDLLQFQSDVSLIRASLLTAINPQVIAKEPANIALNRWLAATNSAFYLAHVFFMVGAVAAATGMILLDK